MFTFVFLLVDFGSFHSVLIMSSMIPLTILSLDIDETVGNLSIEFSGALLRLFMFLLIFNEQRVLKFTFVLVLHIAV
jgi:predicted membrane channel-forming protein YqfA (hemolysin III family)